MVGLSGMVYPQRGGWRSPLPARSKALFVATSQKVAARDVLTHQAWLRLEVIWLDRVVLEEP